jgi:exosortase/archaeosortase family protein
MPKWSLLTPLLKNRLNLFYVLAFAPILLIQYFGYVARHDFFAALIPFYGFLLLLIKKDKLSVFSESGRLYRFMGLSLMLASLFIYYAVAVFFPQAQFYGVANYSVYLVGLFLAFFQVSALKQLFATLFLIVAVISADYVGAWMKFYLEPLVPYFVQIMAFILMVLGIPAKLANPTTFILRTQGGQILPLGVEAGCIGIYSFLTFAIIIVVTMMEDSSSLRTKVLWSVAGIIGTFFVNLVRVSLIFVVIYYFGYLGWGKIHTPIGYVLFFVWLAFFFLIFWKRQAIQGKFQTFWRKLR